MSTLKQILKSPAKGGLTSNVGGYYFLHNDNVNLKSFRTSSIGMIPRRRRMVLEVRRAHFACVRCGASLLPGLWLDFVVNCLELSFSIGASRH